MMPTLRPVNPDDVLIIMREMEENCLEVIQVDPKKTLVEIYERFQLGGEGPLTMGYITKKEARQAVINGELMNGFSQANAERIADGLEPIDEEMDNVIAGNFTAPKRRDYTMTDEQLESLLQVGKMVIEDRSVLQGLAHDIWKKMGDEMGFIWDTVHPDRNSNDPKKFSAMPKDQA